MYKSYRHELLQVSSLLGTWLSATQPAYVCVNTPYHFGIKMHPNFKKDFQEKKLCKQIHFTVRKIYYSFSEVTCSSKKSTFSRLSKD